MASGPSTSWQIDGETMDAVRDFIFWGFKITADGDCSLEIKRRLLLGRKAVTNLDSILKSRDITLLSKVHLVKAMVFPVVMYGYESWTIKKAERWRIDAFELWCWRRLLRVPWTARRSNQSILKEISPEYSLEGLMLKLKLRYFGHLMRRTDSFEKTLMLGGTGGRRRREWQRMRHWMTSLTQWTWVWVGSGSWWWTGRPGMLQSMGLRRVRHDWATELCVLKMGSLRFILFREVFISPAVLSDLFLDWTLCNRSFFQHFLVLPPLFGFHCLEWGVACQTVVLSCVMALLPRWLSAWWPCCALAWRVSRSYCSVFVSILNL